MFSLVDFLRCVPRNGGETTECNVWGGFAVYGAFVSTNWSHAQLTAYFTLTYFAWAFSFMTVSFYFFAGHGGVVNYFMSHAYFAPFARLTYNAYLVHIPIIQLYYGTAPAPQLISEPKQWMDAVAVACAAYAVSLVLFLVVERPAMSLTLAGVVRTGARAKRGGSVVRGGLENNLHHNATEEEHAHSALDEHLNSTVGDAGSEALMLASPRAVASALGAPPRRMSEHTTDASSDVRRPLLG